MRNFRAITTAATWLIASVAFSALAAQQTQPTQPPLPKVWSAAAPFYPPIAKQASIQGVVTLRVTTNGKQVVSFDAESGPAYLVLKTKENVKTWEFQPHAPTSFEITFDYRLSPPSSPCNWDSNEERAKEYVVLHLPTRVELNAIIPVECDPAARVDEKN